MEEKELIRVAMQARQRAYAPYSNFLVGAALLTENGKVYQGCNIENASYGATNCAERTAVFRAVSEGETRFSAIAIVGGMRDKELTYAYPCGICRQVLREFCEPERMWVIVARSETDYKKRTLSELLPESFGPDFAG
ncbi:MAG: cytidine deaminase [Lachnospiraceae bacterium]|nr:cytidine deaminase [Lachnospiraceae bacterium]